MQTAEDIIVDLILGSDDFDITDDFIYIRLKIPIHKVMLNTIIEAYPVYEYEIKWQQYYGIFDYPIGRIPEFIKLTIYKSQN
jgi:hypothetical protein